MGHNVEIAINVNNKVNSDFCSIIFVVLMILIVGYNYLYNAYHYCGKGSDGKTNNQSTEEQKLAIRNQ